MNPFHRGRGYIEVAQWEKAAADFSRAIEISPNDSWSHYYRAQVYAQSNRTQQAIADLRQAIAKGFKDAQQMKADKHLEPIRRSDDYQKLLSELEKNVTKS